MMQTTIAGGSGRGSPRGSLGLCVLAALAATCLGASCPGPTDDGPNPPPPADCPEEDLFFAEACGQTYCGAPRVEVGVGESGFQPLEEDGEVPIWFGSQGGYHIFMATRMENLCPVVFTEWEILIVHKDESVESIHEQSRHVQAVRLDPEYTSVQQFWGIVGYIPCEHWPVDPHPDHQDLSCSAGLGSEGHLENFEVLLRVTAEDHSDLMSGTPRVGSAELRLAPTCCAD